MNKIRQYFSTLELTRGFFIALLSSSFIYLNHWGISIPILNTFLALLSLYLLLSSNTKTWFISGTLIGLFWFWWITVSFKIYEMSWAIPIGLLVISLSYGGFFWLLAYLSEKIPALFTPHTTLFSLLLKATGLLTFSYLHPFGFDWFKPELMFIHSYIGIEKWQFFIILLSFILSIWKQRFIYVLLVLFAYQPHPHVQIKIPESIELVSTYTSVKDKWNKELHVKTFQKLFKTIDTAIEKKKKLIVLPESVFPIFLKHTPPLLNALREKSKQISIVTGALYWENKTPHNSTYIFTQGKVQIANKVLLVPFGESNPLPNFLSKWVNKVFYDNAVDYKASKTISDYQIDKNIYRNAICFEATSEKLYSKDKNGSYPKNMIVLSNNGWFTPSIEPTLQRLLLQYYSQKYGTTIYHSINMSDSYMIQDGNIAEK